MSSPGSLSTNITFNIWGLFGSFLGCLAYLGRLASWGLLGLTCACMWAAEARAEAVVREALADEAELAHARGVVRVVQHLEFILSYIVIVQYVILYYDML